MSSLDPNIVSDLLPALIVGRGRSGIAAEELLKKLNFLHKKDFFFYSDQKKESDFPSIEDLNLNATKFKSFIVSPGYPLSKDWIQDYKKKNIQILNEIDLASRFFKNEKVIGITGSVAKSTCISQIEFALDKAQKKHFLGGNIGTPACQYIINIINGDSRKEFILLELSSYQLESLQTKVDLSIITSFIENHLDRYKSKQAYFETKWNLTKLCRGKVFINSNSKQLLEWSTQHPIDKLALITDNTFDVITECAYLACLELGLSDEQARLVNKFHGLEHRFELLKGKKDSTIFINDSKCTSIDGILYGLQRVKTLYPKKENTLVFIGGKDKSHHWERLSTLNQQKHLSVITFGKSAKLILKHLPKAKSYSTLKSALDSLLNTLNTYDVVLLSPGGASQDEFTNFEERGNLFKAFVKSHFHD